MTIILFYIINLKLIVENIITNKYINNYDNFIENNNIWFIKCKNKLIYLGKIFFPNYIFNDIKHINSDYTDFRKKNIIFIENYSKKLDNDNYKILLFHCPACPYFRVFTDTGVEYTHLTELKLD